MKRFVTLILSIALLVTTIPMPAWAYAGETLGVGTVPGQEDAVVTEMDETIPETTSAATVPEESVPETTAAATVPEEIVPETTVETTEPEETTAPVVTEPEEPIPVTTEGTEEEKVTVPPDNGVQIPEGLQYTVLSDGTCQITGYTGTDAELVIPDVIDGYTVSAIGNSAFYGNKSLTAVTLPASVKSLGSHAFYSCRALTKVALNEELESIGQYAFYYCTMLQDLTFGSKLKTISSCAFYACVALQTITLPDSLSELGSYAFSSCSGLKEVKFGTGMTEIKNYTFYQCKNLLSVDIPENVTAIGEDAFYYCTALETVTFHDGLQSIGSSAFSGCTALTAADIPATVTTIGGAAFSRCSALTEITLREGLTALGGSAFSGCKCLESVVIPNTVTVLENSVFQNCTNLTEVTLPEGLTKIGSSAFYATGLKEIQIPETVTTIETSAFAYCKALESIRIPESVTALPRMLCAGCESLQEIILHGNITSIDDATFENCKALKTITFPENLSILGKSMFKGCTALEEISIPQSITVIPASAFEGCSALTKVLLPETLTEIGGLAFKNCSSLEEIQLPESISTFGSSAFSRCSSLKSIELPADLTVLSGYLFEYCSSLEKVVLPEQLKETAINVFYSCKALKEIQLPEGLETIGTGTFTYCTALENVTIPESVTKIKGAAFSYCESLKEIQLPDGITVVELATFAHCESLEHMEIPESVTVIGEQAFYECSSLLTVNLPAGLQEIKFNAFMYCESLESIEIPDGVSTIPYGGFMNCFSLKHVKLPASLKIVGERAFRSCPIQAMNLPEGVTTIYAEGFSGFRGNIAVPSSVTTLGDFAFGSGVVFYCDLRSTAAAYAINKNIPIVERKDPNLAGASNMDLDNSFFKVAVDGIGASGNLSFTGQYAFKSGINVSDIYFETDIPDHLELQYETLTLDGKKITDFSYGSDGVLKIPLINSSGVIRFQLRPMSHQKISFYARMHFTKDGTSKSEILGTVYELLPALSINAATETSSAQVTVSGITIPGNTVTLLVDGVQKATATANKIGDYTAVVDLGAVANGERYTITAKTNNGSSTETAEKTVVYRTNIPVLEDLIIMHGGQKIALSEVKGSRPVLVFDPNRGFEYRVEVQNPELIDTVLIVSRRGSEEKIIEAEWNEAQQAYVAGGQFDPTNASYVPGDLSVEYIPKMEPVDLVNGFDPTSLDAYNTLPENWKNADVTVNADTPTKTDLSFALPEKDGTTTTFQAVSEQTGIPAGITAQNAESQGYTKITDANGVTQFAKIATQGSEIGMTILDFGKKTGITSIIKDIKNNGSPISAPDFLFKTGKMFGDHIKEMDSYHEMWSDIYNSDLSADEQMNQMSIVGVGVLASAALTSFQAIALVGCVAVAVGGGLLAAPAMAAYGIAAGIFGAARWGVKKLVQRELYARRLQHPSGQLSPRWAIDPSGYVYNADTEERIHGAAVSVYWLPYDGTDETYWDSEPADTVYGELWDASEFSQENPLKTDIEGRYAWDVPEGWWRVKVEHSDYETTWSDWVPVPPPQTEVNIAMTPNETPSIAFADVPEDAYYYDPVMWAVGKGVTNGYGEADTFAPDIDCTRGQIVTFLWRAAGSPEPAGSVMSFDDVAESDFYYKAVLWAVENGITNGYGGADTFAPDVTCTRGQVVTMLNRYLSGEASNKNNPFTDVEKDAFYYDAVLWAAENGITTGTSASTFEPDATCTRGQIVTFLYRALNQHR